MYNFSVEIKTSKILLSFIIIIHILSIIYIIIFFDILIAFVFTILFVFSLFHSLYINTTYYDFWINKIDFQGELVNIHIKDKLYTNALILDGTYITKYIIVILFKVDARLHRKLILRDMVDKDSFKKIFVFLKWI